ncbi:cell-envelope stress modulator CpxP [Rouxiella sp. Mn2063]|uniref:cell-envelope stress modulator CpxP n=1 Tax=Rouxiella sp. Mn2063 TaxID=3395262 RepID=UPI003BC759B2
MSKVAAIVMASMLTLGSGVAFAETANVMPADTLAHDADTLYKRNTMFDGVNLTEQQRQRMRDLMHQARRELPGVNLAQIETMHKLVTASNFDSAEVRAEAEKMAQEQVNRQVEMARIRNMMYNTLTPEQKEVLQQRHEQRMQALKQQLMSYQAAPVPSTGGFLNQ